MRNAARRTADLIGSEFRYGSLTRLVRLPARVDAKDVNARYDRGVLEVSVPVHEGKPEGTRVPIENADSAQAGTKVTARTSRPDARP